MTLEYDRHDLESLFICGDPQFSILNSTPKFNESDAMNGTMFLGMRYGTSTVSFTVAALGTAAERRDKFATLGQWLMVNEPKQLILPDTPDRYYLAVPQGALELNRGFDAEYASLTFTLTDPIACSTTAHTVASTDGVASFTVGGTAPTYVKVTANSALPSDTNNYWGVKKTTSSYDVGMRADIGASTTGRKVVIDSEKRTFRVGNGYVAMDLLSDWLTFDPGSNKLYLNYGSGEFTVEWRDRWYF